MQIFRPTCRYCGALRRDEDDVNMTKSFCIKCSEKRALVAKRAFRGRSVIVVAEGKYVVSKGKKSEDSNG
jgi:hypothetical protein